VQRFKDQRRALTRRKAPLTLREVIARINPLIRGWGTCSRTADVRRLFPRLDGWIEHRIPAFLATRWRKGRWRRDPTRRLIGEFGLVRLTPLIPGLVSR
jgi:RNA-directed DNA polymerase